MFIYSNRSRSDSEELLLNYDGWVGRPRAEREEGGRLPLTRTLGGEVSKSRGWLRAVEGPGMGREVYIYQDERGRPIPLVYPG